MSCSPSSLHNNECYCLHIDMHGLIFERSLLFWQGQPDNFFVSSRANRDPRPDVIATLPVHTPSIFRSTKLVRSTFRSSCPKHMCTPYSSQNQIGQKCLLIFSPMEKSHPISVPFSEPTFSPRSQISQVPPKFNFFPDPPGGARSIPKVFDFQNPDYDRG